MLWPVAVILAVTVSSSVFADDAIPRDVNGRIKRSASARHRIQQVKPCPATGETKGPCPGYVIDHVVPLCAFGADHPDNMQWQTVEEAKIRDREERRQCKGDRLSPHPLPVLDQPQPQAFLLKFAELLRFRRPCSA